MEKRGQLNLKLSRSVLLTLVLGAAGAYGASWLGIPAPWLTGPTLVVTLTALCRVHMVVPNLMRDACFLIIGMTMGAGITPETIATAQQWPITIVALCVGLAVIIFVGSFALRHVLSFDRETAFLSSIPGHLSYVLGLSTDTKADIATVSIIQSLRVLFLTLAVPFLVISAESDQPVNVVIIPTMSYGFHLMIGALSLVAGLIFQKIRVPAAFLFGGMSISAIFHATAMVEGNLVDWLTIPAFVLMGTVIGTRFNAVKFNQIIRAFFGALIFNSVAILVTVVASYFVVRWTDLPITHVLIALAPGGLETMAAMGVLMGANPAFVAAHHTTRLLFLTFFIPLIMKLNTSSDPQLDQ